MFCTSFKEIDQHRPACLKLVGWCLPGGSSTEVRDGSTIVTKKGIIFIIEAHYHMQHIQLYHEAPTSSSSNVLWAHRTLAGLVMLRDQLSSQFICVEFEA